MKLPDTDPISIMVAKRFMILFPVFLLLFWAASSFAAVTLTYTGGQLASPQHNSSGIACPSANASYNCLQGTLTLQAALAPNLVNQPVYPLAASFNNGQHTYLPAEPYSANSFYFSTDAHGNITAWHFTLSLLVDESGTPTAFASDSQFDYEFVSGDVIQSLQPGVWNSPLSQLLTLSCLPGNEYPAVTPSDTIESPVSPYANGAGNYCAYVAGVPATWYIRTKAAGGAWTWKYTLGQLGLGR